MNSICRNRNKVGMTDSRIVPLKDSISFAKNWIENDHHAGTNPNSWLFVSLANGNYGSKLTYHSLNIKQILIISHSFQITFR